MKIFINRNYYCFVFFNAQKNKSIQISSIHFSKNILENNKLMGPFVPYRKIGNNMKEATWENNSQQVFYIYKKNTNTIP